MTVKVCAICYTGLLSPHLVNSDKMNKNENYDESHNKVATPKKQIPATLTPVIDDTPTRKAKDQIRNEASEIFVNLVMPNNTNTDSPQVALATSGNQPSVYSSSSSVPTTQDLEAQKRAEQAKLDELEAKEVKDMLEKLEAKKKLREEGDNTLNCLH